MESKPHPVFDAEELYELAALAKSIQDKNYSLRELFFLGCDRSILFCFYGQQEIPAIRVLCCICLCLGVDIWSDEHDEPSFRYIATRVRRRLAELRGCTVSKKPVH
jgi:hypothetical protein